MIYFLTYTGYALDWLKKKSSILKQWISLYGRMMCNVVARTLKKLRTSKGDYWIKHRFSSVVSLFKMGTSLKGKNLLPEGANSFLYEQFLIVGKITFITLSDLPWILLFFLRMRVARVMGATPMMWPANWYWKYQGFTRLRVTAYTRHTGIQKVMSDNVSFKLIRGSKYHKFYWRFAVDCPLLNAGLELKKKREVHTKKLATY